MATALPPVKNSTFSFEIALVDQSDTDVFKTSVTLAAGDVQVSKDGAAFANIASLPSEIGTSGVLTVALSSDEMNADRVVVLFHDAAGDEWQDAVVTIYTTAQTLDTIDTNVDSILADTGTDGVVLADDAITSAKYDESTAFPVASADSGATQIARTGADSDTLETLSDQLDGVEPADVWTYSTRTLTQAAATVNAAVSGGTITILRGDTLSASITGLGDISARSKLWWTVKDSYSDTDPNAILQVEETGGLLYVNGGTAGTALASITVSDENAGDLTIAVDETITDDLVPRNNCYYDIQMLTGAGAVTTLTAGTVNLTADVTRRVA